MARTLPLPVSHEDMVDNIISVLDSATDEEREEGLRWYRSANTFAAGLVERYGLPSRAHAAGIIAALSPRLEWGQNLRYADGFCATGTFPGLNGNAEKARRIMDGENPLTALGGNKVLSFFLCVAAPGTTSAVAVDRHAIDIAFGAIGTDKSRKVLDRKGAYGAVADAYRTVAEKTGLAPCEVQAITWVAHRNRKNGGS